MQETDSPAQRQPLTMSRRRMLASAALSATGLSALAACSNTTNNNNTSASGSGGGGNFPSHPKWKFVFVNHVTTNAFFTPTRYGIEDACALLGCTYQWVGSESSKVSEMVDAMNAAISSKADGIAVALIDPTAFNAPTEAALSAGIPVLSYNADVPANSPNKRLAYIGQDLYQSGLQVGAHIISLVPSGEVVGFIATPGSLNIQPRIDGIHDAIKNSGKPINFSEIATGAAVNDELAAVEAYYLGHKNIKGMFAVDGGSTQSVGQIMEKYSLASKGIHGGGYDLQPITLSEVSKGNLDFTVDQQPYLQGFLPVVQLFLYKLSGGLSQPSSTNTGLLFVTKNNVQTYLKTQTRFEGSSDKEVLVK
ncbi:sugar ABC transporter substrate-binding protein [Dictyobacter sp. S3.2.2.5]|uniref:Sugar ABC transporter substrate-binding protein n=1 Tax=Dictyobacter halimunensis TaxID=3026934 RepID=A0ABQ6G663_9CHLR|nr:sugar ABC transporter substrate-binding protein [Dictyobacter sp. S3.2.2.5]